MSALNILLRRELWENRAITAAPAVIGGLLLLITFFAVAGAITIHVGDTPVDVKDVVGQVDRTMAGPLLQVGLMSLGIAFNTVMILVVTFYLLDSLYADRKDRSILFWKSLPVSDTTLVLSKLATAAIVVPAVTLTVYAITVTAIYLVSGAAIAFAGNSAILIAGPGAILNTLVTMVYALLVQSLWYMPIFGWLLLASAWAKRAVLLWAILPPVALIIIEDLVNGTANAARMIGERVAGVFPLAFRHSPEDSVVRFQSHGGDFNIKGTEDLTQLLDPGAVLASTGLWGGFVIAAVFVAGAIWLRRYRDET